jgi:hypothetical protein
MAPADWVSAGGRGRIWQTDGGLASTADGPRQPSRLANSFARSVMRMDQIQNGKCYYEGKN